MVETNRRIGRGMAALTLSFLAVLSTPAPGAAQAPEPAQPLLDVCPIDGEHDLIDSWGWRRSGGRRHQGIDVAAARGTELYAVRDGVIDVKQNRLGGNAIWLVTDDGDEFYYAHLDRFEGDDRRVRAGDVIGYVGSTGNAGGPHLHFEAHPGGSVENPFEHVVAACTPSPEADQQDVDDGPHRSSIDAFVERLQPQTFDRFAARPR